jgi:hypothetical protein
MSNTKTTIVPTGSTANINDIPNNIDHGSPANSGMVQTINFTCSSTAAKSIVGDLFDIVKKLFLAVFIFATLIALIGIIVYVSRGRDAFINYWTFNLKILTTVFSLPTTLLDKIV